MEKKPKTVGLDFEVWKALKGYALERDCTLSEAVRELLEKMGSEHENHGNGERIREAGQDGHGEKP